MRNEIFCDTFVIMPNPIHAILRIDYDIVGKHGRASLPQTYDGVAYRSPKSTSSFVAGFKSAATKRINEHQNSPRLPVSQSRFHDHIIRNDAEYQGIFSYIETNIENWEEDELLKAEKQKVKG